MKNIKSFIAYLLVAVFLLGSIAASANTLPEKSENTTIDHCLMPGSGNSN
ncbi:hypothetical protein [Pontibacter pudoricolor]|nr:hypothetical protein [Pontibacter pudoricolor]